MNIKNEVDCCAFWVWRQLQNYELRSMCPIKSFKIYRKQKEEILNAKWNRINDNNIAPF